MGSMRYERQSMGTCYRLKGQGGDNGRENNKSHVVLTLRVSAPIAPRWRAKRVRDNKL